MTLLRTLLTPLRDWHARRSTIDRLLRLDDRTLKDIGLNRCDIVSAVDEALRRSAHGAHRPGEPATLAYERPRFVRLARTTG